MREFSEFGISYATLHMDEITWYDTIIAQKLLERYNAEKTEEDPASAGSKRTE
jgi:hypothetical protein